MKIQKRRFIFIIALLPLSLMADGILTHRSLIEHQENVQNDVFELKDLVAKQAAVNSASYATTSSPYYYTGF